MTSQLSFISALTGLNIQLLSLEGRKLLPPQTADTSEIEFDFLFAAAAECCTNLVSLLRESPAGRLFAFVPIRKGESAVAAYCVGPVHFMDKRRTEHGEPAVRNNLGKRFQPSSEQAPGEIRSVPLVTVVEFLTSYAETVLALTEDMRFLLAATDAMESRLEALADKQQQLNRKRSASTGRLAGDRWPPRKPTTWQRYILAKGLLSSRRWASRLWNEEATCLAAATSTKPSELVSLLVELLDVDRSLFFWQGRSPSQGRKKLLITQAFEIAIQSRSLPQPVINPLRLAAKWAENHFADAPKVSEMARAARITIQHLNRLLKQHVGISAKDYLSCLQLEAASKALKSRGGRIEEVSVAAGFHDQAVFSRRFKALRGLPPSLYLELLSSPKTT